MHSSGVLYAWAGATHAVLVPDRSFKIFVERLTQNEGNVPANLRNGLAVPAGHVVGGVVDAHAVFVPFLYELEKFSRN